MAFRSSTKKRDEIGFKLFLADLDVWLRFATKLDGSQYYEYLMMYIDEFLEILTSTTNILKSLEGDTVKYKNGKIAPLYMYLVYMIQKKSINNI